MQLIWIVLGQVFKHDVCDVWRQMLDHVGLLQFLVLVHVGLHRAKDLLALKRDCRCVLLVGFIIKDAINI